MKNAARIILNFVLQKLENEPLEKRATLCEALSQFWPDEAEAHNLRNHAEALRQETRRSLPHHENASGF